MRDRIILYIGFALIVMGVMGVMVYATDARRDVNFRAVSRMVAEKEVVYPCYVKVDHYVDPAKVDPSIPDCITKANDWRGRFNK